MSNETIRAIASIWPLALIIFLLIMGVLFRPQIIALLSRLAKIQIRKGDTEVVILQQENKEPSNEPPTKMMSEESSSPAVSEKTSQDEKALSIDLDSLSQEDLMREIYLAFFQNNIERAEQAFSKLQASEKDQVARYRNEANFLYLKFSKGDTSVLEKLKHLEEAAMPYPAANASVLYQIGKCYEMVSQFDQALLAFEKGASLAQEESKKAHYIVAASNCYSSLGKKDAAFNILEQSIGEITNQEALSTLYQFLSELYGRENNKEMKAIALEKALEYQPNDTSLKFKAAYSYSEGEFKNLTLYHYIALNKFSPEDSVSLNNLGVAYGELEMPIQSIKYYKKSWEQKSTLAAANLAYKYLRAGFTDDARGILSKAKTEADIHPNVGGALSEIPQKEEQEIQKEHHISAKAMEQQRFLLSFAQNYFPKIASPIEVSGYWMMDGEIIDVTQNGKRFEALWGKDDNKKRFSGILNNKGAIIDFEKWGYNLSKMNKSFVEDGKGFAFLLSDLKTFQVMIIGKNDYRFVTITRHKTAEENTVA